MIFKLLLLVVVVVVVVVVLVIEVYLYCYYYYLPPDAYCLGCRLLLLLLSEKRRSQSLQQHIITFNPLYFRGEEVLFISHVSYTEVDSRCLTLTTITSTQRPNFKHIFTLKCNDLHYGRPHDVTVYTDLGPNWNNTFCGSWIRADRDYNYIFIICLHTYTTIISNNTNNAIVITAPFTSVTTFLMDYYFKHWYTSPFIFSH